MKTLSPQTRLRSNIKLNPPTASTQRLEPRPHCLEASALTAALSLLLIPLFHTGKAVTPTRTKGSYVMSTCKKRKTSEYSSFSWSWSFFFVFVFCYVLFCFSTNGSKTKNELPCNSTSAPFQDYKQGLSSQSILANLACRCLRILVNVVVHAIVILLLNFRSHSVWTTLSFPEQFGLFRTL